MGMKVRNMLAGVRTVVLKDIKAGGAKRTQQRAPQKRRLPVNQGDNVQRKIDDRCGVPSRNHQKRPSLVLTQIDEGEHVFSTSYDGAGTGRGHVFAKSTTVTCHGPATAP